MDEVNPSITDEKLKACIVAIYVTGREFDGLYRVCLISRIKNLSLVLLRKTCPSPSRRGTELNFSSSQGEVHRTHVKRGKEFNSS